MATRGKSINLFLMDEMQAEESSVHLPTGLVSPIRFREPNWINVKSVTILNKAVYISFSASQTKLEKALFTSDKPEPVNLVKVSLRACLNTDAIQIRIIGLKLLYLLRPIILSVPRR